MKTPIVALAVLQLMYSAQAAADFTVEDGQFFLHAGGTVYEMCVNYQPLAHAYPKTRTCEKEVLFANRQWLLRNSSANWQTPADVDFGRARALWSRYAYKLPDLPLPTAETTVPTPVHVVDGESAETVKPEPQEAQVEGKETALYEHVSILPESEEFAVTSSIGDTDNDVRTASSEQQGAENHVTVDEMFPATTEQVLPSTQTLRQTALEQTIVEYEQRLDNLVRVFDQQKQKIVQYEEQLAREERIRQQYVTAILLLLLLFGVTAAWVVYLYMTFKLRARNGKLMEARYLAQQHRDLIMLTNQQLKIWSEAFAFFRDGGKCVRARGRQYFLPWHSCKEHANNVPTLFTKGYRTKGLNLVPLPLHEVEQAISQGDASIIDISQFEVSAAQAAA